MSRVQVMMILLLGLGIVATLGWLALKDYLKDRRWRKAIEKPKVKP